MTRASVTTWQDQHGFPISSEESLADQVALALDFPHAELWLQQPDEGQSLCLLSSPDRAVLVWQPSPNEDGMRSHNPAGNADERVDFRLANGEKSQFPGTWAVAKEEALRAYIHFFRTGERAGWLEWSAEI